MSRAGNANNKPKTMFQLKKDEKRGKKLRKSKRKKILSTS